MKLLFYQTVLLLGLGFFASSAQAEYGVNIYEATLAEPNQKTPEISTREMQRIVEQKSATVIDPRSSREFAIDHIPGAINIPPKKNWIGDR